jgi:tetratricopeptide (TPR) repeat protein
MSWLRTMVLLSVVAALASVLSSQSSPLEEGVKLIRDGRFDQALIKLQEAHRIAPRNAIIDNLLGIIETQLGHNQEARAHYRDAIRLDPSQAAPHKNLGFNLLDAKDYAAAEPELHEASRLDPGDNFAHYYLLLLALATGHDAEAFEQATHAGQLLQNDPEAGAGLIAAEIRTGHGQEAAAAIDRLEKADQLPPAREYPIAVLLSQRGFHDEAVHCFKRIASLDPSWQNRYNLALGLLYDGQYADASALLAPLHAEQPANADISMYLGSALESQQRMPEALEAYRAAAAADPTNPDRTLDYTRLLMDLDRYDEAIQIVQTGLEKTNETAPLQLRLGAVEMLKSNYPAARDAFNAALALDPSLDVAYVGLAQTYARQANDAEALRILESARAKLPDDYALEYYFGLLAARSGREQEAMIALQKASQLASNSPDPFFELGKLYAAKQDWPLARKAFEQVIALNPQFVPAHYQLSRIYAHLGLNSLADEQANQTRTLVNTQRDEALRKQRERAASFQPQPPSTQPSRP